jgi:hypothetical protein
MRQLTLCLRARRRPAVLALALAFAMTLPLVAQQAVEKKTKAAGPVFAPAVAAASADQPDYDAIFRIKEEGFQRSQVMEITSYLTDVYGGRLAGSPNYNKAAEWAKAKLAEWGLANARLEAFEFGRGWSNEHLALHVVEPQPYAIIGYPKVWTPGTAGPVRAEVVAAPIESEADFEKHKGKLRGKIVLAMPMRDVRAAFEPLGTRFSENELAEMARQDPPMPRAGGQRPPNFQALRQLAQKRDKFFLDEGVVAALEPSRMGDGGTVFVQGGGSRNPSDPPTAPQLVLAVEHYGRIWRTNERKVPVTVEIDVKNTFHDADRNSYNILAELPGSDPTLASEIVMLGGHFDGWHAGTGATDNAAGSAAMMEAVRIIKAAGLRPRRTIRLALWGGEEQGLLGARAYVKRHYADRETLAQTPEHGRVAAYFNIDNGTGRIRGIWMQGNLAARPIFESWIEGLRDLGVTLLGPRSVGSTDHVAFDEVGLPGFQFIQERLEYGARTHHSNMDQYDRVQRDDMVQMATVAAVFAYNAAMRDQPLPRKPLPERTGTSR